MKAFCVNTAEKVAPFGELSCQMAVDGTTLAEVQHAALEAAGLELVATPPQSEPYFLFSDRTWFTADLVRQMCRAGTGRLVVRDSGWLEWTSAQQKLSAPGTYELAVTEGEPGFDALEPIPLELEFRDLELPSMHDSFAHAADKSIRVGTAMVHQLDHWSHIIRINQLGLLARMEDARAEWEQAGVIGRLFKIIALLWRARSLNGAKIAASLSERGDKVQVHPTAVVEFSELRDGCEIGPHAVVRGSVVGPGAKVDAHAVVNASILGAGARIGRYGHVNLCTLFDGAMVSAGDGFQVSVFGRNSFVAWGSTILDLSFGGSVKVESDGPGSERVDSGLYFLGAAVGHRAKIGHGVKIGYGVSIPNDALLVDDSDLLREWGDGPLDAPAVIRGGRAVSRKPQD